MPADQYLKEWFTAHDAYHKASNDYNSRLALVRAERDRGNWSMTTDAEYKALGEAQSGALKADETLYAAIQLTRKE